MTTIHPTAIIHPNAQIADTATIGPFCVVGEFVSIGDGTVLESHTTIEGHTRIGKHNKIGAYASLGGVPQDMKYAGEPTRLEIGDHNTIREFVSIHIGTVQGGGVTKIGDHNWIMGMVHVAHDCIIGNHTILANYVGLAGHVVVEDYAFLGGQSGYHQFCRIGAYAMVAAKGAVVQDVAPFMLVGGHPIQLYGLNRERLKRENFPAETVSLLKKAYRIYFRSGLSQEEALAELAPLAAQSLEVNRLLTFIKESQRGITR